MKVFKKRQRRPTNPFCRNYTSSTAQIPKNFPPNPCGWANPSDLRTTKSVLLRCTLHLHDPDTRSTPKSDTPGIYFGKVPFRPPWTFPAIISNETESLSKANFPLPSYLNPLIALYLFSRACFFPSYFPPFVFQIPLISSFPLPVLCIDIYIRLLRSINPPMH